MMRRVKGDVIGPDWFGHLLRQSYVDYHGSWGRSVPEHGPIAMHIMRTLWDLRYFTRTRMSPEDVWKNTAWTHEMEQEMKRDRCITESQKVHTWMMYQNLYEEGEERSPENAMRIVLMELCAVLNKMHPESKVSLDGTEDMTWGGTPWDSLFTVTKTWVECKEVMEGMQKLGREARRKFDEFKMGMGRKEDTLYLPPEVIERIRKEWVRIEGPWKSKPERFARVGGNWRNADIKKWV